MVPKPNLKFRVGDATASRARPAKQFVAGGKVGALHQRLRSELGVDWDDALVSESARA